MEKSRTLLLVEDEPVIAENETTLLRNNGFQVVYANSGEKALQAVREKNIDLILMDLDLGTNKMDGGETARAILDLNEYPIVFLTCHAERCYVEKLKKLTYYGYVPKDCGEFLLLETIENALRLYKLNSPFSAFSDLGTPKAGPKNNGMVCPTSAVIDKEDFRSLAENAGVGIMVIQNHQIVYVNETAVEIYGYEKGRFLTTQVDEILQRVHPEDRERIVKSYQDGCRDLEHSTNKKWEAGPLEYRHCREDGLDVWVELITTPITYNENLALLVIHNDITERKRAQAILKDSEDNLKTILENLPLAVFAHDMEGRFVLVNRTTSLYTGYSQEELMDLHVSDIDPESVSRNDRENIWQQLVDKEFQRLEAQHVRKDGSSYPVEIFINAIQYKGRPILLAIAQDVTERKKVIEQKDYLMKELNHRVKNNLLMISSLIGLKNSALEGLVDLSDLQHQIDAIRIVHEKLYQTEDITSINVREYSEDLLSTLFSTFAAGRIRVENDIDNIVLPTKLCISLGLIINEIATNAVKHAFPPEVEEPRFVIDLHRKGSVYHLGISNNGPPFPEEIGFDNPQTLGLRLISVLVEQIDGEIEITRKPYPVFTIRFPAGSWE